MFVSIIMPVYNAELYIESTIMSILNQTYHLFELIIIDDCSIDSSCSIIKKIMQKDSRIIFYQLEENSGGPATPRNYGIKKSKYNLVCFVDSDDIWDVNKLEIQLKFFKGDSKIKFLSTYKSLKKFNNNSIPNNLSYTILSHNDLIYKNFINNSSVMIYKEFLNPFNVSERYIAVEDAKQWLDITNKDINCYLILWPLIYYREVVNSLSSNKFKMLKRRIYLLKNYCNEIMVYYFIILFLFYSIFKIKKPFFNKTYKFYL